MRWRELGRRLTPGLLADAFAAGNLGFLAVDIGLAHAANGFAAWAEWVPVVFSAAAPLLLLGVLVRPEATWARRVALGVGSASVAVGVLGMALHLESGFFESQTI